MLVAPEIASLLHAMTAASRQPCCLLLLAAETESRFTKAARAAVSKNQAAEARDINRSLLTLAKVVCAARERARCRACAIQGLLC